MRKDKNDFGYLGKVEWRRIEQPTFPLRMRALCNQIKSKVIPQLHNPFSIQTKEFLDPNKGPVQDEETWKRWWGGGSVPQTDQLAACELISPGARNWLELSEMGNPIQRHMLALDAVMLDLTKDMKLEDATKLEDAKLLVEAKLDAQKRSLKSLELVWGKFTQPYCANESSPLNFERQILNAVLPDASLKHATVEDKIQLTIYSEFNEYCKNPYHYEFSEKTRQQYNFSDKFGLFKFFQCVRRETQLQQQWLRDIWILDMATLVACMRTELIVSPMQHSSGFGQLNEDVAFWTRLFWNNHQGAASLLFSLTNNMEIDERLKFISSMIGIRHRYYELLSPHGINYSDILHIAWIDYDITECSDCWKNSFEDGENILRGQ